VALAEYKSFFRLRDPLITNSPDEWRAATQGPQPGDVDLASCGRSLARGEFAVIRGRDEVRMLTAFIQKLTAES